MLVRILPVVMSDENYVNDLFWIGDNARTKGIALLESLNLLAFKPNFTIKSKEGIN